MVPKSTVVILEKSRDVYFHTSSRTRTVMIAEIHCAKTTSSDLNLEINQEAFE